MNEPPVPSQETPVPTTSDSVPFPDELLHLWETGKKLDAAIGEASAGVQRIDAEYLDKKRYMADYRGEIDPHEMFQQSLVLGEIDRTGAFAAGLLGKLQKLKESPYFARIDFQAEEETAPGRYYIGRFAFIHQEELLIFDWRAPIASMFYDCEVGPAAYVAPMGTIQGDLIRKRQFQIKGGKLQYALESSLGIRDDVLQKELSHTSDEKMKSIISTIQKEQNQIIRDERAKTMIIQGVAGSGKTSIALHRIAFLLYRFKETLTAQNVAILSPNRVFGDYISTVLPELGEEPILEMRFADIAQTQLRGIALFEPDRDPLENEDAAWAQRVRFKSSYRFLEAMDAFLAELPTFVFEPGDYVYGGLRLPTDWVAERYAAYHRHPVKKRLERVAEDIHDRFESAPLLGEGPPRMKSILKALTAMLKFRDSPSLYRYFYQWLGRPELLTFPAKGTLEWADVYPLLYLHSAFAGLLESKNIQHLVIDEMQDYTPIQYAVINRLYPCQKTILGDFGQFINPNHLHDLHDLLALYPDGSLVRLQKSYRSTYEIITFAGAVGQMEDLEPMERHGEPPLVIPCQSHTEELMEIGGAITAFLHSRDASLGIILKTSAAAKALHTLLAEKYSVQLLSSDSTRFVNGVTITSIQMAKGLEFDRVLVPDTDAATYYTPYDRSLLYIAATRAMHNLTLLYVGTPSPLLPG